MHAEQPFVWRLEDEPEPVHPPSPIPPFDPRLHVLIVPGAFAECSPEYGMPFEDAAVELRRRGIRIDLFISKRGTGPTCRHPSS